MSAELGLIHLPTPPDKAARGPVGQMLLRCNVHIGRPVLFRIAVMGLHGGG